MILKIHDSIRLEYIRRIKTIQFMRKSNTSETNLKNQMFFFYNDEFEKNILNLLEAKYEN